MGVLDWKHHTLIQALLSRGPLLEADFRSTFTTLTGKNPGTHQELFNEYLLKINKELAYVQLELRGCRNQYDGLVYYGLVNNVADDQSKLGTKYSAAQLTFYKAIVDLIVQGTSPDGTISSIHALNVRFEIQVDSPSQGSYSPLPPALKNFSMSQREKTVEDLIHDKWLSSPSAGNLGLGVRSFLDLRSWFHANNVTRCEFCNEAGIKASICSNRNCPIRIHDYCLKQKFSQKRVDRVCPGCGLEWDCSNLHFEDIPTGTADVNVSRGKKRGRSSSQQPSAKKRADPKPRKTEVESTDSESYGDPQLSSHRSRAVRRSSRKRTSRS